MRKFIIFLALGVSFSFVQTDLIGQVKMASPKKLSNKIKSNSNIVIIDLRTDEEVKAGMIEGAVQLDFYGDGFEDTMGELDKSKTYYIYCKSGGRSSQAARFMEDLGFKTVFDLEGGITQWQAEGYELKANEQ